VKQFKLIRARTGEGRKRAMARGVRFGRPRKLNDHQRREAIARLEAARRRPTLRGPRCVDATTIGRLLIPFVGIGTAEGRHLSPA
jgi:DNA invertase Pin-like site-specific DNA recombinase